MERTYWVVDAFTAERFAGNPAAVVFDADGLDEPAMRLIAREFNLSETTFVLRPQLDHGGSRAVRFRWFTPAVEVAMCGHATLAGIHALAEGGRLPRDEESDDGVQVLIETKSGVLAAFVEPISGPAGRQMIWFDLPNPVWRVGTIAAAELARALGVATNLFDRARPCLQTQDQDLIAFVVDLGALNRLKPDFRGLGEWLDRKRLRGLCLATTATVTPSVYVQSRFFAPHLGIDEDPVTGSVHGPLAAFLVREGRVPLHDDLAALTCVQGIPGGRTGLLHVLVQPQGESGFGVRVGGEAVTTMRGRLVGG